MPPKNTARKKTREQIAAEIRKNFANNVRILRKRKQWTQDELADKVGIARCTINRIEVGLHQPRFADACMLADILGVSVSDMRAEIWDREH